MSENTETVESTTAAETDATEEASETATDETERKPSPKMPDPSTLETEATEYGEARVVDVFGVEYGFYVGDDALEQAEAYRDRLREMFNEDAGRLIVQTQAVTKSGWANYEPHNTDTA